MRFVVSWRLHFCDRKREKAISNAVDYILHDQYRRYTCMIHNKVHTVCRIRLNPARVMVSSKRFGFCGPLLGPMVLQQEAEGEHLLEQTI